ncbi:hypothetical protein B1748_25210 [Paenibacillus sp. MY03]|uniref:helix-turn-helix domain-containing protein n=1 Tax=Paenibacillus sp. MY03 TaxID=302980 RepID=UPI000B3D30ED|nr:helix-turn-helix domain-containing protein [Paenibacillus sp. MY03]OUS72158.1 hypothetical protein B1748_25210 [Paenibacillus sp. MY03]
MGIMRHWWHNKSAIRRWRTSIFWALFLSFLTVLISPVVFGSFLYTRMSSGMVENVNRSNAAMLEQVKQVVDLKIRELNQDIVQLSYNPKLDWLLRNGDSAKSAKDLYKFIEYINELNRYRQVNGTLGNFFIYLANTNMVLTPKAKTVAEDYFKLSQVYQGMEFAEIKETMLTGYHNRTFLPSVTISNQTGAENRYIPLIQSLPMGEVEDIKGSLVLLIDEQHFNELMKQIESASDSIIYIVDENNQLIMTTNESTKPIDQVLSRISSGFQTFEDENDGVMLLTYTSSSENGWKYIAVTPKDKLMSKVNEMKVIAFAILLVYLIVGVAACFSLTQRYYRPLREVVTSIMSGKHKEPNRIVNELDFIKNTIKNSFEEEEKMRTALHLQAPVIKANYLIRLIKGQMDVEEEARRKLESLGICFTSEAFRIILIDIGDSDDHLDGSRVGDSTLIPFIITNIGSEILGDRGYIVELDSNQLAVLINSDTQQERQCSETENFIAELRGIVERRFNIKMTTAISNFHLGMDMIGHCYREARIAMDYKMIRGEGTNIAFEEIKDLDRGHYHYPHELETQLLNLAKSGDFNAVKKQLEDLFELNFLTRSVSPEMGKCFIFDLLGTILKLQNTLHLSGKVLFAEGEAPIKLIMSCNSTTEMLERMKELFHLVCSYFNEEKVDHSDRLYNRIKQFIDANYKESSLTVIVIADHVRITPQYLSNFFRKHSGQTISDYISRLRIERSKEMLADRSLTISMIAQKLGYSYDIGLIRTFKKIEGITPGKYRELIDEN